MLKISSIPHACYLFFIILDLVGIPVTGKLQYALNKKVIFFDKDQGLNDSAE
jgi:hypothetical protein